METNSNKKILTVEEFRIIVEKASKEVVKQLAEEIPVADWTDEFIETWSVGLSERLSKRLFEIFEISTNGQKMNPAMANTQEEFDRHTGNPIDMSNAPEDADHNFNYSDKPNKAEEKD